jgi:flagellar biosynthesis regulator FlaF
MMSRAAVHEHRITKSQQRLRRDITELAAIIDEARDAQSAARAILDAGYRRESASADD